MPNTGPGTSHRHKTKTGYWYDLTDLQSGDDHTHPFEETRHPADTFTDGEVVKLKALLAEVQPSPEPVPPPPAPSRPFAAPTITGVRNVLATDNLQQLVDAAPNGTEFRFPSGAVFNLSGQGLVLRNRQHLRFVGNGSRLNMPSYDGATIHGAFKLDQGNRDIAIHDFEIVGTNPNTTTLYVSGIEAQMGIAVYGSNRVEIDNIRVRNVYGDGVFVAGKQTSPYASSEDVWIHDSAFDYIGRMGIVHNACVRGIVERCSFNHVGMFVYDIECDYAFEVVDDVAFRQNQVGSYGLTPIYTNWFVACSGGSGSATVRNVVVEGNTITTGAPINSPNNPTQKSGIATIFERLNRVSNVTFRNNTGGPGSGCRFVRVDGLLHHNNLAGGTPVAVTVSDCTNVRTTP